jgi:hypothetical protein
VQPAITSSIFHVVQIAENPTEQWVNAFVSDGVQQFWITILDSSTYHPDWNDQDITNSILAYISKNYQTSS